MAGDVVFTATLADQGVSRGLRGLDEEASRLNNWGGKLKDAFGKPAESLMKWAVPGIATIKIFSEAMRVQTEALEKYAKVNDMAAAAIERRKAAGDKALESIGREISLGTTVTDKWGDLKTGSAENIAAMYANVALVERNVLGGLDAAEAVRDNSMIDNALRDYEGLQKEGANAAAVFMDVLKAQEEVARNQDEVLKADQIKARIDRLTELAAVAKRVKDEGLSGADAGQLVRAANSRFDSRMDKAQADEDKRRADVAKSAAEEQDKIRREAQAGDRELRQRNEVLRMGTIEFQNQREITRLQLEGLDKSELERDILEERIKLRGQLLAIEKDTTLVGPEKQVLAADARLLAARQIEAMVRDADDKLNKNAAAQVTMGAAGVLNDARIFGAGGARTAPGIEEARKQVKLAEEMVRLQQVNVDYLKRFVEKNDMVSVFGM